PAIVPQDADASLLIHAVRQDSDDLQMPPSQKLSVEQIESLRNWVNLGAPWPADTSLFAGSDATAPRANAQLQHWAYQPVRPVDVPLVSDTVWSANPIDCFIWQQLSAKGLAPSAEASPSQLCRRLYLDLCGLPPTYEQLTSFTQDTRPDAYARLVEQLLASREYAEHWARHWLDVARYADTKGYLDGGQTRYAFAYTYRDYVIRAFEEDLPYAAFVRDQIAADQYDLPASQRWRWAAMGFLTTGRRFNDDPYDTMDDRLDVIGRGLLGITIGCARCHDHKYDPLTTAEYYGLSGILGSSYEPEQPELPLLDPANAHLAPEYAKQLGERLHDFKAEFQRLHDSIQHEMRAYAKDYLTYLIRSNPIHRPDGVNPIKTDRTLLRGPTAYGFGALARWERYLDGLPKQHSVFGLWLQLRDEGPDTFAEAYARACGNNSASIADQLRQALSSSPPANMLDLAAVYGDLLETAYASGDAASPSNRDAIQQVLFGDDSPTHMTLDEAIDCYHLDEHVALRRLRSKIEEVTLEQTAPPPRPMMMLDRKRPVEPRVLIRGQAQRPGRTVPR
ncbi:MAG: DUF1549 domain-containing protein, partial [Planctomycetales bacterium]|nr:DUF1549 domain-containing protein [Planctomycetales bacterium]